MAAAIFEAVEQGDRAWRELDIRVLPGISAMQAAAAEAIAPAAPEVIMPDSAPVSSASLRPTAR